MKLIYQAIIVTLAILAASMSFAAPRGSGDWQKKSCHKLRPNKVPAPTANKRALKKRGRPPLQSSQPNKAGSLP